MFRITSTGNHKKTSAFLDKLMKGNQYSGLDVYGQRGVNALSLATPVDTGMTANSWEYRIFDSPDRLSIIWFNTNIVGGIPVAILLQYGHATGTGGYVAGRDYINPVMSAVFDQIAKDVWEKVIS